MKQYLSYFSKTEWLLWSISVVLIAGSFFLFDRQNYLTLLASVTGITSLIFTAKGHPVSQVLMILFSLMYGYLSFEQRYYGEMITYVGMTAPMALVSLITWLHHPFAGSKSQVAVKRLSPIGAFLMVILTASITICFYFILSYFHTANLIPSTVSVATSFLAVYLTACRSEFYALAYAANDLVLIVLWLLASVQHIGYLSVVVCFAAFFFNDIYGYLSWKRMRKRQEAYQSVVLDT